MEEEEAQAVAEVSCTAVAAQLSGGRRGHFSLLGNRCNADGSQGYGGVVASTGHMENTGSRRRGLIGVYLSFMAAERLFSDVQIPY